MLLLQESGERDTAEEAKPPAAREQKPQRESSIFLALNIRDIQADVNGLHHQGYGRPRYYLQFCLLSKHKIIGMFIIC
jgi:hypothetical protein